MVLVGLSVERWGVQVTYIALAAALSITALAAIFARAIREPNNFKIRQGSTLQ
jgi:hypothetical protein